MFGSQRGLEAVLHRQQPSSFRKFLRQPCVFLVTKLYNWRPTDTSLSERLRPVTVVCISDTHNTQLSDIPAGDILIHAGDVTQSGTRAEFQKTLNWIKALPHPTKILIAGNHDIILDSSRPHTDSHTSMDWGNIIYLNSESTTVSCENGRQLNVYGCPLTPRYGNWPFQHAPEQDVWHDTIPEDTDILITHGPPKGHLDNNSGCKYLLAEIWRRKPILHVFGHVHIGYGVERAQFDRLQKVYESTVIVGGGLWNLGQALFHFIAGYVTPGRSSKAIFVNAAITGGLRDEFTRRPIVVRV
ncbi:metallophosphoesterase domain-containing protein [Phaeosphaeriaceae sp. PMI808]|nr:metallophosphoesterase domain-containing protein [Phaeosphaeriaceae sp. PMI808]